MKGKSHTRTKRTTTKSVLTIELWFCVTALISNRANWRRARSTCVLAQYDQRIERVADCGCD
jgi:hypothetical protein